MKRRWIFLINPFETATKGSYIRAYILGNYTMNFLKARVAQPDIAPIVALLQDRWDNYVNAYGKWRDQLGEQSMLTAAERLAFKEGPAIINDLMADLTKAEIFRGSPKFTRVFPNLRKPFNRGGQDSIIAAYKALATGFASISMPAQALVASDFHARLLAASDEQGTGMGNTMDYSHQTELARIELCDALFEVLADLIKMFVKDTEAIEPYFLLRLIRKTAQKVFVGHTKAGETKNIAKRTMPANTELTFYNGGVGPLEFWLAGTKAGTDPMGTPVIVAPGEHRTVTAADLGDVATSSFLTVRNPSGDDYGVWQVDISPAEQE